MFMYNGVHPCTCGITLFIKPLSKASCMNIQVFGIYKCDLCLGGHHKHVRRRTYLFYEVVRILHIQFYARFEASFPSDWCCSDEVSQAWQAMSESEMDGTPK